MDLAVIVPSLAAIAAALLAARSASQARRAQTEADKVHRLEQRLATHKREVYEPMIEVLGSALDKGSEVDETNLAKRMGEFSRWVAVVGSDDAVRAFRDMMQATYNDAPPAILIRLYAEFQLAARRDMGDPDTTLTAADILGMRFADLYKDDGDRAIYRALTAPLDIACAELDFEIPWTRTPRHPPSLPESARGTVTDTQANRE